MRFLQKLQALRLTSGALVLAAALLSGGVGVRSALAQTTTCTPSHVVQPGENLFRIALAAGVSWTALLQYNNISDANLIYVGQVICLPGSAGTVLIVPPVNPTPIVVPTPGLVGNGSPVTPVAPIMPVSPLVYPTISFDRYYAVPGEALQISGVNFPPNATADVLITPLNSSMPYTAIAQTTTSATGTVSYTFTIPTTVNGAALQGNGFSVMVRAQVTGYYGFNFFYNTRGF